jgi:hypothetical protein
VTIRQTNLALRTIATLLGVAAVVVLVLGILTGREMVLPEAAAAPSSDRDEIATPADPLQEFERVWTRRFQGPDRQTPQNELPEPAPIVAAATNESDPMPLTLVGTVGRTLALLRTTDGTVEVRAVGETLAGAEIVSVEPSRVEVRYNGRVVTLVKPEPPAGAGQG